MALPRRDNDTIYELDYENGYAAFHVSRPPSRFLLSLLIPRPFPLFKRRIAVSDTTRRTFSRFPLVLSTRHSIHVRFSSATLLLRLHSFFALIHFVMLQYYDIYDISQYSSSSLKSIFNGVLYNIYLNC